jgi:putative FmdB family regulatory protein
MPIYEYECLTCGTTFDKRQRFSDRPLADCPEGHPETRRLLSAPTIVFKGSGFYVNDSKSSKNGVNGSSSRNNKSETKSETKSESRRVHKQTA